ncbi:MAG TPA: hypothetical protein VMY36_01985 [Patescibacteria group bacterium]|nr:hypothetical protein [Patescibacteria group bacterium]
MNKKIFLFLGIILVLVVVIGGVALYWSMKSSSSLAESSPLPTPLMSPEATLEPVALPAPTASTKATKSDLEQIKEAFAEEYSKPLNDVNVTMSDNTGTYAKGGVSFAGEIGGGWWLAYNDGSDWIIVADGNGTVMCEEIEPYYFPVDMVPECWNEATSELIER